MKLILVDDEPLALEVLERKIRQVNPLADIETFVTLQMNVHVDLIKEVEVVFLDIEMPHINGIELAEQLLEVNPRLSVVFVTAFHSYAIHAFELNALDYLLKPVSLKRLQKTFKRIESCQKEKEAPVPRENLLRIQVSGDLRFQFTNGESEVVQWRTSKAQELFLYLLHHDGKTVRKDELIELLWPEVDQEKAFAQLYTTIYHIRKTLERFTSHFSIKNQHDGYILSIKNAVIDLVEWEKRLDEAPPVQIDTIRDYETLMELYKNPYLDNYNFLWAEAERFRLEKLWLKTAYEIGICYDYHHYFEEAEAWFTKVCRMKPEDEYARFYLMKRYATSGQDPLVDLQYEQLENALDELNLHISDGITRWYSKWSQKRKKAKVYVGNGKSPSL
ncbi:response regulator [Evansella halocellulosilytica]|uniref:response regulator n=1 Tax=Evansella halocellulosilytica TaxID=2011013 RepID=UPI000BB80979|nr:response regulator [Evansella halocellulosilytica]